LARKAERTAEPKLELAKHFLGITDKMELLLTTHPDPQQAQKVNAQLNTALNTGLVVFDRKDTIEWILRMLQAVKAESINAEEMIDVRAELITRMYVEALRTKILKELFLPPVRKNPLL
jgi:membrane-associated HD superfamily phosphohydrolase